MNNGALNTLITYGSLMPGKSNFHIMADIPGVWSKGTINGHLVNPQWELLGGYPALILDDMYPQQNHQVAILKTHELSVWLPHLDAFEGSGYQRVVMPYQSEQGLLSTGWVYVAAA